MRDKSQHDTLQSTLRRALGNSLSHQLARVFRQHSRAYGRAFSELGLTATHAHILIRLWMEGPQRIGSLQKSLALSSATFTGAVDRMEKAKLLVREKDPDDGRATQVRSASWTKKRKQKVIDTTVKTEQECFAVLTQSEQKELRRLLTKISSALETGDRL